MFCFNEFAFTVQVKHKINSTQILGLILICLYFSTGHFHTCVLCNECSIYLPFLILGSVFSDCVVFYGDDQLLPASLIDRNAVAWRLALSYVHRFTVTWFDIIMSDIWHYNVIRGDVTWRSLIANVRYILRCFCLRFVWRLTVSFY